jgi:unsaturated pyranuronate lyase
MVRYMRWDEVQNEDLRPGLSRRCVHGEQLTVARVLLQKGIIIPEHSHVNEQVTYILDGWLRFYINGEIVDVRAGEVLCIPSNVPHKAEAMEDTIDLDVFQPVRQDWVDGTDAYIRREQT